MGRRDRGGRTHWILGQLDMANMGSEYVKWLFLETFLHPNSTTAAAMSSEQRAPIGSALRLGHWNNVCQSVGRCS